MTAFIDENKESYGVEPICRVLPIAPSTYYEHAVRKRTPEKAPPRIQRDGVLKQAIQRVWEENFRVYGVRKVWRQLKREGEQAARCTVARLMKDMGLKGIRRGKSIRTTISNKAMPCPLDRVNRTFRAARPNALWVSDFTYVSTWQGWVYVAFVIDVFKRVIVGWKVSDHMNTQLVLDALNQALDARGRPSGVIHHSDKGSQYLSIKYGERLKQSGLAASVGTTGDSYDNALAESVNGLYKAEVIDYLKEEWDGVNDVALATLDWVHWYNHERLHSTNGYVSPVDAENIYYCSLIPSGYAA